MDLGVRLLGTRNLDIRKRPRHEKRNELRHGYIPLLYRLLAQWTKKCVWITGLVISP